MAASFPSSVKSFSTKVDDIDDVEASHINDLQDEVVAIETHLVTNYSVFCPLTSPLTSTSWDGDSFSTTSKTKIDLSSVFGVPAGIKAVLIRARVNDSGSAASNALFFMLSPIDNANIAPFIVRPGGLPNDYYAEQLAVVPCNSDGDVYYQVSASGSGTMDVVIQIWGYWV